MDDNRSEFGRGVIVCLGKFSEHLWNRQAQSALNEMRWARMTESQRDAEFAEARQYPKGDASQRIASRTYSGLLSHLVKDPISEALTMWANGASDHFYELDRSLAPPPLCELADLTLEMGHGFSGRVWTEDDWSRIHELWQAACLALDATLGVKDAEWGQW